MTTLSNTQIDRLGDRLRQRPITDSDLAILDSYRRSFSASYELVIQALRDGMQLEPTGRAAKSTSSIVEKLRRESVRLSQMQDIAGCRIVVSDVIEQDRVVAAMRERFAGAAVDDRREHPSHGYRAIHIIPRISERQIEIQIRTRLQHMWAELSEIFSDLFDPAIKYGGGPGGVRQLFAESATAIANLEAIEKRMALVGRNALKPAQLNDFRDKLALEKEKLSRALGKAIAGLEKYRKPN